MICDNCADEAVAGPLACIVCGREDMKPSCADEARREIENYLSGVEVHG